MLIFLFSVSVHAVDVTDPVITDNQGDDSVWTGSWTYDVDFYDAGGSNLESFQVQACSYMGYCGDIIGWTDVVTGLATDTYNTDWVLPAAVWNALTDDIFDTNYISVQAFDGSANSATGGPLFSIYKDTYPPNNYNWSPGNLSTIGTSTPIITFITNHEATCRWELADNGYAAMPPGNTCPGGGTVNHSCSTSGLTEPQTDVYISCTDSEGHSDDSTTNSRIRYNLDLSPPVDIAWVYDSLGGDVDYATSSNELTANWAASSDPETGLKFYWYAVGTTAGATDTRTWTSISAAQPSTTAGGMTLSSGQTYYFSVKAENDVGNMSGVQTADGVLVDYSVPGKSNWSPATGSINTSTPTVTFNTDENADCKWSLADLAYGTMAGDCTGDGTTNQSCDTSGLVEGTNNVYIACNDSLDNADSIASNAELVYILDTGLPTQSNWVPAKGLTVSNATTTINFNTNENTWCRWSLADQDYDSMAGDCTGDGTTVQQCSASGLSEGANTVFLACMDEAANKDTIASNEHVDYTLDTTPPVESNWNPPDMSAITTTSPGITFDTDESAACNWSLTDQDYSAMLNVCGAACSITGLSQGTGTVHIACTDSWSNSETAATNNDLTYFVDSIFPIQSNWDPARDSVIATSSPIITFDTSENADCKWALTDWDYSFMTNDCTGDGTASQTCPVSGMSAGTDTVYISCRDTVGNEDLSTNNEDISYYVDLLPPAPSGFNPSNGASFATTAVSVTFNTDENADCKWSLTDQAYGTMAGDCTGDGTTSQTCPVSGLAEGVNSVHFSCRDSLGNEDTSGSNEDLSYTADTSPPVQSGWSPANGFTGTSSTPTVSFNTDENADCKWSLTDQAYSSMTGDCDGDNSTNQSCSISGLAEATNTVHFACNDSLGNSDTSGTNDDLTYYLDTTLPVQSNWNPAKDSVIASTAPTVTFDTSENADCKWSATDQDYGSMTNDCTGDGTTSQSCDVSGFSEASNTIFIACSDTVGNSDSDSTNEEITYFVDYSPPIQSNWNPADGSVFATTTPLVSFDTDENAYCAWSLTDEGFLTMPGDCDGDGTTSISCDLSGLSEGTNSVHFGCVDDFLNMDSSSTNVDVTYVVDTRTPVINGFLPDPIYYLATTSVTITLGTDENAYCRWNLTDLSYDDMAGSDCTGGGSTVLYCDVTGLPEGSNDIYIACMDTIGNKENASSNTEINYYVDYTPPVVSFWVPATGTVITENPVFVEFELDGTALCKWSFEDLGYDDIAAWNCDGEMLPTLFGCSVGPLVNNATNTIFISCKDRAGNSNTALDNFGGSYYLDTSPPDLSNFDPATGTTIADTSVTLAFNTSENASCRSMLDDLSYDEMVGFDCTGGGTTGHSCTINGLVDGPTIIYVSCADTYGNEDTADSNMELGYTVDTTIPVVSNIYPLPGSFLPDTAPTVTFDTDEVAGCKWSLSDTDYRLMPESCGATGTGHSCSVTGLSDGAEIVYVGCSDEHGNETPADDNEHIGYFIDTSPPADIAWVNDGTGADIDTWATGTELSGNWAESSDSQSSIAGYWYSIGTSPGASQTVVWTDNGDLTSFTKGGLSLSSGQVYYISVKAENYAGLMSNPSTSDGVQADFVDTSPPVLSNWEPADQDWIATTTPGVTFVTNENADCKWSTTDESYSSMSNVCNTTGATDHSCNSTGLAIPDDILYFTCIDTSGNDSTADSIEYNIDITPPPPFPNIYDGPYSGIDIDFSSETTELRVSWEDFSSSSADEGGSGLKGVMMSEWYTDTSCYAGTTPGGSELDFCFSIPVTHSSIIMESLTEGETYYFTVVIKDNAGNETIQTSDGITIDTTLPGQSNWNPAKDSTISTTSPAVTFDTDEPAYCRWSDTDTAYFLMSNSCSGGETTEQSCPVSGLAEGTATIFISCMDRAGNADDENTNQDISYTVNQDSLPPQQSNWDPPDGSTVNAASATVTFGTDEAADCRWSLSDLDYSAMTDMCGTFDSINHGCLISGLSEGINTFSISCADTNIISNEDTASTNEDISYTLELPADTSPPVQSGWNPASGSALINSSQTVFFETDEAADCRWSLSDESYSSMAGDCTGDATMSQTCPVTGLAEGTNYIFLACRDTTGNEDSADSNTYLEYTVNIAIDNIVVFSKWNLVGFSKQNMFINPAEAFGDSGYGIILVDGTGIKYATDTTSLEPLFTRAYWIWSDVYKGEIPGDGDVFSTSPHDIPISTGWNAFSSPYNETLDWADSNAALDCGGSTPLPDIYSWSGTSYSVVQPNASGKLKPWLGYYIYVSQDCTLKINK